MTLPTSKAPAFQARPSAPVQSATVPDRRPAPSDRDAAFIDYFRTPAEFAPCARPEGLSAAEGYFRFGETVCYGRRRGGLPAAAPGGDLGDAGGAIGPRGELPFDLAEVVRNLREERYTRAAGSGAASSGTTRRVYYFLRPWLPVPVRKHLQQIRLSGWERIAFPRWPVDVSVETLMQGVMATLLRSRQVESIPFVWFWPDGAPSAAMMTHDVEGPSGRAFCGRLMDLDESFGITSAFQVVPELPRTPSASLLDEIRARGFEVNLHDLNHDGRLFASRTLFLERAAQINRYARQFGCRGFRSGAMYREQAWFEAFDFSFDMSVPSVAHLEPQRGGCCTVMPYFVGKILELPLTTTQDYSLFHILGDYSTTLWRQQIEAIRARHGLISFIAHPDYLRHGRALAVYTELLEQLRDLRDRQQVWLALPTAVDAWWRIRHQLSLVRQAGAWRIVGAGAQRARVAHATLEDDRVVYRLERPA